MQRELRERGRLLRRKEKQTEMHCSLQGSPVLCLRQDVSFSCIITNQLTWENDNLSMYFSPKSAFLFFFFEISQVVLG
jgi:hypothetical protein